MTERVLIYRLGSLGDTIVALPAFHLIRRVFPEAERRLLTAAIPDSRAVPVADMLAGTGLVHSTLLYPLGLRNPVALWRLLRSIRAWRPDVLVYLAEPRGSGAVWRDILFFWLCGVARIVGAPTTDDLRTHRLDVSRDLWESEASRLGRCMAPLGDVALDDAASWDLHFNDDERRQVDEAFAGAGARDFIAFSIGAKIEIKDWGDDNWRLVLAHMARRWPDYGLILVGAASEAARAGALAAPWPGPVINLCGRMSPRASAVAIGRTRMFVGHDTGPMHMAAAVGVPAVAVFAGHAKPGVWFPHGARHRPIYHRTPCFNCGLDVCIQFRKQCIMSIGPDEVIAACEDVMAAAALGR